MKNFLTLFSMLMLLLSITACDPCSKTDCGNGVCDGGTCTCNEGYEKDANGKCSIESRSKFLGTWSGPITATGIISGSASATISISQAAGVKQVIINNLFTCTGASLPLTATVSNNQITSIDATTCTGATISFSNVVWGVNGNSMTLSFNYNVSGAGTGTYSGVLTK